MSYHEIEVSVRGGQMPGDGTHGVVGRGPRPTSPWLLERRACRHACRHAVAALLGLSAMMAMLYYSATPAIAAPQIPAYWTIAQSPNASINSHVLSGIAAVSPADIWTVGFYVPTNGYDQTLIEHWNGRTWSIVPSPNVGTSTNILSAVTAFSASDVWAVGKYYNTDIGWYQTLTEHWNGTAWSIVPSLNLDTRSNEFWGVTAVSSDDVWAVGDYFSTTINATQTLIEHWDGVAWNVVSSPNNGTSLDMLRSVTAISPSDVWTVGVSAASEWRTLIEHWNGTAWSVVPSPNVGNQDNDLLYDVAAISANDMWAVGFDDNQTLTEHWNGTTWNVVPSANCGSTLTNALIGVAALSASNVWAVGYCRDLSNGAYQTLIEHWNGTAWSTVRSPGRGTGPTGLEDIVALSATNVWAAGYYSLDSGQTQTLIEHYSYVLLNAPTGGGQGSVVSGTSRDGLGRGSPCRAESHPLALGHTYRCPPGDPGVA